MHLTQSCTKCCYRHAPAKHSRKGGKATGQDPAKKPARQPRNHRAIRPKSEKRLRKVDSRNSPPRSRQGRRSNPRRLPQRASRSIAVRKCRRSCSADEHRSQSVDEGRSTDPSPATISPRRGLARRTMWASKQMRLTAPFASTSEQKKTICLTTDDLA